MSADTAGFLRVLTPTAEAELHLRMFTDEWDAALDWLRFHNIDPTMIPAGSIVEVDRNLRQIRYRQIRLDEQGKPKIDQGGLVAVPAVEQGEALAAFPPVLEAAFSWLLGNDESPAQPEG